jgi:paired amphipathic helix protein Sin3a
MAERLFEGEMDPNTFEESLRVMYGTKAYVLFTLDRVIAAIVKQVSDHLSICSSVVRDQ